MEAITSASESTAVNSLGSSVVVTSLITISRAETRMVTIVQSVTEAPSVPALDSNNNSNKSTSGNGLSSGAIAGIVVGVVFGVLLLVLLFIWACFGFAFLGVAPLLSKYDDDDDELESQQVDKDDVYSVIASPILAHKKRMSDTAGLTYTLPDNISLNGRRRFSAESLPDAANGQSSISDNSKNGATTGGLRVLNPDLLSDEEEE